MDEEILSIIAEESGERIDALLARTVENLSRSAAQRLIEQGAVLLEGRTVQKNTRCEAGMRITVVLPETQDEFDFKNYDYVVDAIDTVTGKLAIIQKAKEAGVPVISSMGAGNKVRPAMFEVADIYKTSICPLAKVMRKECKKRGIDSLKVVYSKEEPLRSLEDMTISDGHRRAIPGSVAFSPSVAGLIIAGEVINDIAGI